MRLSSASPASCSRRTPGRRLDPAPVEPLHREEAPYIEQVARSTLSNIAAISPTPISWRLRTRAHPVPVAEDTLIFILSRQLTYVTPSVSGAVGPAEPRGGFANRQVRPSASNTRGSGDGQLAQVCTKGHHRPPRRCRETTFVSTENRREADPALFDRYRCKLRALRQRVRRPVHGTDVLRRRHRGGERNRVGVGHDGDDAGLGRASDACVRGRPRRHRRVVREMLAVAEVESNEHAEQTGV